MIDEIKMVFPDFSILVVAAVSLVLGLILGKGKRKLFLIPGIIITIIIVNPLFYNFWYKFNNRAYWRTFWMLPVISLCAFVPALLIERMKKDILKTAVMLIGAAVIIFFGEFVYKGTTFVEARNADKLPDDVVAVADALLELDDEPYVVADVEISTYLRQYDARIKTLYTRDVVYGGANSPLAEQIHRILSSEQGEWDIVSLAMLNNDYEYLVTNNSNHDEIREAGFSLIKQINSYGIYSPLGNRREVRYYNSLHQIISRVFLDLEDGAKDTDNRIARIEYKYGSDHKLSLVYYFDAENNMLQQGSGYFFEFLRSLENADNRLIIFSAKDDAFSGMTEPIFDQLRRIGLLGNANGKRGDSYYSVFGGGVTTSELAHKSLNWKGIIQGLEVSIISAGFDVGNYSSIMINGIEYSENKRGLNVVVYDTGNNEVIDSFCIDTFLQEQETLLDAIVMN